MKKLMFALVALLVLGACHRPRVRHDHSKKVQAIRLPVDSAKRNDIAEDDSWKDEALIALPEGVKLDKGKKGKAPAKPSKAPANVDEQIERMMMGQDDGFGELPE